MSDIHIGVIKDNSVNCVFHIVVPPALENDGGVLMSEAIRRYESPIVAILPDNSSVENTAIENGEVIENEVIVKFAIGDVTALQKFERIKEKYNTIKASYIEAYQRKLRYYGKEINI